MPQTRKIATCCYCGTRAVLVLDRARHELSCSACGAPLHDMKVMPQPRPAAVAKAAPVASMPRARVRTRPDYEDRGKRYRKDKKRRKRKPLTRKLFEEIWDVVEDIFD